MNGPSGEFDPDEFRAERGGWALQGMCIGLLIWPPVIYLIGKWMGTW